MSEINGGEKWLLELFTVARDKWSAFLMALRDNGGSTLNGGNCAFLVPSLPEKGFYRTLTIIYQCPVR